MSTKNLKFVILYDFIKTFICIIPWTVSGESNQFLLLMFYLFSSMNISTHKHLQLYKPVKLTLGCFS